MSGNHLCLILAADANDYVDWCRRSDRIPFDGTAWAISSGTGEFVTSRRTFQVTDRWQEGKSNRRIVREFADSRRLYGVVPYGDENGPWPAERIPDLNWPTWWQRVLSHARWPA